MTISNDPPIIVCIVSRNKQDKPGLKTNHSVNSCEVCQSHNRFVPLSLSQFLGPPYGRLSHGSSCPTICLFLPDWMASMTPAEISSFVSHLD